MEKFVKTFEQFVNNKMNETATMEGSDEKKLVLNKVKYGGEDNQKKAKVVRSDKEIIKLLKNFDRVDDDYMFFTNNGLKFPDDLTGKEIEFKGKMYKLD